MTAQAVSWESLQQWFSMAWPSLVVLVVTAAVAFGIGMLLRYRRAKIQRDYQQRMEQQREQRRGRHDTGT